MMDVFTYGTLIFPEVWHLVVGRDFATVEGSAANFAIYRVADAVFPGMIETPAGAVRGVVYLDVDARSLARLDRFEDDFYERRTLAIECEDGICRQAEAYVVPLKNRKLLTGEAWDREQFRNSGGLDEFMTRYLGFTRI